MGKRKPPQQDAGRQAEQPAPHPEPAKKAPAVFYRTLAGGEPVREWLKDLDRAERKLIGEDIATVEFGWPLGMPACRPMGDGLHEVRTNLPNNRIARIFFYVDRRGRIVLLHAIIKKSNQTPDGDLDLARANKHRHERGLT